MENQEDQGVSCDNEVKKEANQKEWDDAKESEHSGENDADGPLEEVEKENVTTLKSPNDEYKSKYFYLAAEMENLRKRNLKEKENTVKFGNEKLLTDLIDVLDNFERSLSAMKNQTDDSVKNILVGIKMTKGQLEEVLKKYGLCPIDTQGKAFDPNLHEAVAQRFVQGVEENMILEEFQKGYLLSGRLLRASKVVVAKAENEE